MINSCHNWILVIMISGRCLGFDFLDPLGFVHGFRVCMKHYKYNSSTSEEGFSTKSTNSSSSAPLTCKASPEQLSRSLLRCDIKSSPQPRCLARLSIEGSCTRVERPLRPIVSVRYSGSNRVAAPAANPRSRDLGDSSALRLRIEVR